MIRACRFGMELASHCRLPVMVAMASACVVGVTSAQVVDPEPVNHNFEGLTLDLEEVVPIRGERQRVEYVSRADDSLQPAFAFLPARRPGVKKVPLLVILHTWSGDYRQRYHAKIEQYCEAQGWAYIHPHLRGPNRTPAATGSDLVVADVVSAVAWAKRWADIDNQRVYLLGTSGGGYTALLLAGRRSDLWSGVSAWVPIVDLARWFADCKAAGHERYAANIAASCGGVPGTSPAIDAQYRQRSPLTWLAGAKAIPVDINAGIRDGLDGSVPVRHSLLAFNAIAGEDNPVDAATMTNLSAGEVPESLQREIDPGVYGERGPLFRRQSGRTRVTLFDGGHELVAAAAMAWLAEQVLAVEPDSELPRSRTHYRGREIAKTMHWRGAPWLMRPKREKEENTRQLLAALKLQPGQTVCDLGAGNGYHTLPMAKIVGPEGRALAVDIQPQMLKLLTRRAKQAGVDNIRCIESTIVDPKLAAGSCDLILLVDVYHEFSHPEIMLDAMRRALKPTGRLAIVEFRAEDPEVPIKKLHKMTKTQILRELIPNGYRLVESYDELPWQHVMFFARQK